MQLEGGIYQTPARSRSTSILEADLLDLFHYNQRCFIMHEHKGDQLSVAAAVERCGWSKATALHTLVTDEVTLYQ